MPAATHQTMDLIEYEPKQSMSYLQGVQMPSKKFDEGCVCKILSENLGAENVDKASSERNNKGVAGV